MRLKFIEFLMRHQAFAHFYSNVIVNNYNLFADHNSLLQQFLIDKVKPQHWIQAAFKWQETEDFDYWHDLDEKWKKELKIMQN